MIRAPFPTLLPSRAAALPGLLGAVQASPFRPRLARPAPLEIGLQGAGVERFDGALAVRALVLDQAVEEREGRFADLLPDESAQVALQLVHGCRRVSIWPRSPNRVSAAVLPSCRKVRPGRVPRSASAARPRDHHIHGHRIP